MVGHSPLGIAFHIEVADSPIPSAFQFKEAQAFIRRIIPC